ncbi:hypothetical protein D9M68_531800 [compost metagenome]
MNGFFDSPLRGLAVGNGLLWLGLAMLVSGILGAYLLDRYLSLVALVLAHGLTILGPTLIKVGYVMRLLGQHNLHLACQGAPHAA